MGFCCYKKEKVITQFYKATRDKLIEQLEFYINDTYGLKGHIYGNYNLDDYNIFIFRDDNRKLEVKCKIYQNKFNYNMIVYEIY